MNLALWDSKLKIQEFISMCNVKKGADFLSVPYFFLTFLIFLSQKFATLK